MKKIIFLSLVFALTAFCSYNANASGYTADDNLIDQMFTKAPEAVNVLFSDLLPAIHGTTSLAASDKSAGVALVLDFFLGALGVHRFYLGTESDDRNRIYPYVRWNLRDCSFSGFYSPDN